MKLSQRTQPRSSTFPTGKIGHSLRVRGKRGSLFVIMPEQCLGKPVYWHFFFPHRKIACTEKWHPILFWQQLQRHLWWKRNCRLSSAALQIIPLCLPPLFLFLTARSVWSYEVRGRGSCLNRCAGGTAHANPQSFSSSRAVQIGVHSAPLHRTDTVKWFTTGSHGQLYFNTGVPAEVFQGGTVCSDTRRFGTQCWQIAWFL